MNASNEEKQAAQADLALASNIVTFALNDFVLRQVAITDRSQFGGFTGGPVELQDFIRARVDLTHLSKPVEVVRLYPEDADDGRAVMWRCTHDRILPGETAEEVAETRRPGEQPVTVRIVHRGSKPMARTVDLVFYSHEALGKDATTEASYELVSINGMPERIPEGHQEPMTPSTIWRNYLSSIPGCPAGIGGTFREKWKDEEVFRRDLGEAERYWADKARVVCDL